MITPHKAHLDNALSSPLSETLNHLVYEFEAPSIEVDEGVHVQHSKRNPVTIKRTRSPLKLTHWRRKSLHTNLAKTAIGLRNLAKRVGETWWIWGAPPSTVMIVVKPGDDSLISSSMDIVGWLLSEGLEVYVQKEMLEKYSAITTVERVEICQRHGLKSWEESKMGDIGGKIEFVVTFGGDGTLLFAAWLFQGKVPPIIPFHFGSLGFLTVFPACNTVESIKRLRENEKGMRMNFRMRFCCTIHNGEKPSSFQVLNEIVVDRGPSPFLSHLELFGNEAHLTTVQADGLVIATPTGSTAYSLSAGGPVVHPDVSAILVTPICPHTLSFRPMILPDTMEVKILVPLGSRATAWASFDGRHRVKLMAGDFITIVPSPFPVPTVCKDTQSIDWFHGLESCLAWNKRKRQKGMSTESDIESSRDVKI